MYGIIRTPQQYADGQPSFEIDIHFEDREIFPFALNEKYPLTLIVNNEKFQAVVISKDSAGSWISPTLYNNTDFPQRLKLSSVLLKLGYANNQRLKLSYAADTNELSISQLTPPRFVSSRTMAEK